VVAFQPRSSANGATATEAMDEGHCGLPIDELVPLAEKRLEVPQELIRTALDFELADGAVIADMMGRQALRLPGRPYRAERGIADRLLQLGTGKPP
jgi:exodeoxyribonuclease V alpha subunit